jgi:hypothetical protein
MPDAAEFDWGDLLFAISEQSVVPVVGDELRLVEFDGTPCTVEYWSLQNLPNDPALVGETTGVTLNQLAIRSLEGVPLAKKERHMRRIASTVVNVFQTTPPPIPESLLKLAEVTSINLFITTAVDTLLEQAIEQVRGVRCQTMANSLTSGIDDLNDVELPGHPVVYHLFGSMPRGDDYAGTDIAITEEEKLEYLRVLGDNAKKPRNLFDLLREKELMFLGCDLSDGVARQMIRTVADCRLFPDKSFKYVSTDDRVTDSFRLFMEGLNSELLLLADPREFTDELVTRWKESAETVDDSSIRAAPTRVPRAGRQDDQGEGFVFVSYRRADKPAVQRLVSTLESEVNVWWDDDLEAGLWEAQLETRISECALFIPILSRAGQEAGGSVAKKEWNLAIERRLNFSDDEIFIIPLIVDDLEHNAERIPSKLWREQVYTCRGGDLDDRVIRVIVKAFRQQVRSMRMSN